MWTWVRDRRHPRLAEWFNAEAAAGRVLTCDAVVLELIRLTPNGTRARAVAERLDAFGSVPMPAGAWSGAREIQIALADAGDHRGVPPIDLLIAEAAQSGGVELIHYDRDYERIAAVTDLAATWLVPPGTLA